jgi:hypothetical protein
MKTVVAQQANEFSQIAAACFQCLPLSMSSLEPSIYSLSLCRIILPLNVPIQELHKSLYRRMRATCPTNLISLDLTPQKYKLSCTSKHILRMSSSTFSSDTLSLQSGTETTFHEHMSISSQRASIASYG